MRKPLWQVEVNVPAVVTVIVNDVFSDEAQITAGHTAGEVLAEVEAIAAKYGYRVSFRDDLLDVSIPTNYHEEE